MKMSPIKKIVIGIAAITVALSLITANNMASVMLIVASRQAGSASQQSSQTSAPAQQSQSTNCSQGGSTSSGDSAATDNTATNTVETTSAAADNTATNTVETTSAAADNSTGEKTPADDNKPADDKGSSTGKKLSDKELVDLYKKAVNAARTKSTSVVRVKDGAINYKGIAEAGKLSGAASTLMGMFMKSDASAIEAKNEPWEKEKLPDANALTLNSLQKISYEEKDGKYIVTLIAKNASNPKEGADGVGAISGVIEDTQITGAIGSVPGLTLDGISIDYENVTSVATIDKATGNLVALNLDAPCVLNIAYAKIPLIGEVNNARVGIQVITEYTVAY